MCLVYLRNSKEASVVDVVWIKWGVVKGWDRTRSPIIVHCEDFWFDYEWDRKQCGFWAEKWQELTYILTILLWLLYESWTEEGKRRSHETSRDYSSRGGRGQWLRPGRWLWEGCQRPLPLLISTLQFLRLPLLTLLLLKFIESIFDCCPFPAQSTRVSSLCQSSLSLILETSELVPVLCLEIDKYATVVLL